MGHLQKDANLSETKALPAAAASAVTTGIDLGALTGIAGAARLEDMEWRLTVPACPDLVDDKTIIYSIETDNDVAFGSAKVVNANLITMTGAGGVGCAAVDERFKLPSDSERYVRVKATVLVGGGDNTGISFTLDLLN